MQAMSLQRRVARSRRRGCRYSAARQDGHDHSGKRQASVFSACAAGNGGRVGGCRPNCLSRRRNAGGAQHRRPGEAEFQLAPTRHQGAECHVHTFFGANPDERVNLGERQIRKGAADAIMKHVASLGRPFPRQSQRRGDRGETGKYALVVCDGVRVLGVVALKDIVKGGIKERFADLRHMGIKTIMITGDNRSLPPPSPQKRASMTSCGGNPEAKLKLIRHHQAEGRLVAMTGDGTNDAPALRRPTWRWR